MNFETLKNTCQEIIAAIAAQAGCYLINVKLNRHGHQIFVKALVAHENNITIEQLTAIAKNIRDDERFNALVGEGFQLEVSSPGIDYPLREPRDFRRNLGREINLFHRESTLKSPVSARIDAVTEEGIIVFLKDRPAPLLIKFEQIDHAKVLVKW